jgi:hypothetical protein
LGVRDPIVLLLAFCGCAGHEARTDAAGDERGESSVADLDGTTQPLDSDPHPRVALVAPDLWVDDVPADPMPSHRPADAQCDLGFGEEAGTFEVDTQLCSYGVFSQPMLDEIRPGDVVELSVIHDALWSEAPATAHILVQLGDAHTFETEVDIPGPYGFFNDEWIADLDVPAGTPAVLHLHNHGFNSWRLVAIVARGP